MTINKENSFKVYTVVYEVGFEKVFIEILKMFNRNKP